MATVIVVPYQDRHPEQKRAEHLAVFLRKVPAFLADHGVRASVVVAEQVGGPKFNRGLLLNAGYKWARDRKLPPYTIFHDVDLVPSSGALAPYYGEAGAAAARAGQLVHLAACWGRYDAGRGYLGGALGVDAGTFERLNGFPNDYWGWGGEDDEFRRRCATVSSAGGAPVTVLPVTAGSYEDLEGMDLSSKLALLRVHKSWKNMEKWEKQALHASTWQRNGVRQSGAWRVLSEELLSAGAPGVTVVRLTVATQ